MILPKIYKRTSTGKVQEWTVEVEGDSYRTIAGQKDGKAVISKWTKAKGKNTGKANATTDEEQALKEAQAKHRLKLEGEYSASEADIDKVGQWKKPLLAEEYSKFKDRIVFPCFVQPKLDGMRNICKADGQWSRKGKPIHSAPHIMLALRSLFTELSNVEFDGELYNHTLKDDFDTLISIVKQLKPSKKDLELSAKMAEYWVYDIRDQSMPFEARYKLLTALVKKCDNPMIKLVPTYEVKTQEELDAYYKKFLDEGYEGMMIRNNTNYEYKRTVNLLKRKEVIDAEFIILDVLEGEGNRSGGAGKLCFELNGEQFEANPKATHKQCEDLWINKEKYIGKSATVRYQNLTPRGVPRFGRVTMIDRESFEGEVEDE